MISDPPHSLYGLTFGGYIVFPNRRLTFAATQGLSSCDYWANYLLKNQPLSGFIILNQIFLSVRFPFIFLLYFFCIFNLYDFLPVIYPTYLFPLARLLPPRSLSLSGKRIPAVIRVFQCSVRNQPHRESENTGCRKLWWDGMHPEHEIFTEIEFPPWWLYHSPPSETLSRGNASTRRLPRRTDSPGFRGAGGPWKSRQIPSALTGASFTAT